MNREQCSPLPSLPPQAEEALNPSRASRPDTVDEENDILSLKHHLVNWLFTPLYLLLLFSTVTGYISALKLSNQPYDMVFVERARLMASRFDLTVEGSPSSQDDLLPNGAGGMLYSLFDTHGQLLLGNASLPKPRPDDWSAQDAKLRDMTFLGEKMRLLTLHFSSTRRKPGSEFLLVLAEPVDARLTLGRSILGNIVIPQFIFILIAGVAVWIGFKRGFEPLEKLRQVVAKHRGDDLRPLDDTMAPSEIRPLIREVNALIERLKITMEQQKNFIANAAHQLRTPFAGLRAQAELARREEAPPAVKAALEGICEGAGRCSRLVTQLLILVRNEPAAREGIAMQSLDLHRIAQEAAMQWVPEAMAKKIDLGYESGDVQLPVFGDEHALRDLIDNLLDNAIRYTPNAGHITLRTGYERGAWLMVEDNGPGIPPDERAKVFGRFYRVAGSGQPGSGLGLAIVSEVTLRHGASVEVGAADGERGAVFMVRFPHHGEAV